MIKKLKQRRARLVPNATFLLKDNLSRSQPNLGYVL